MPSTLELVIKVKPMKPGESERDYNDRIIDNAFVRLYEKKNRTEEEEQEFKKLTPNYIAYHVAKHGYISGRLADEDLSLAANRLRNEFTKEFGESPMKITLIDRLVCAWNMAVSYERMWKIAKYRRDDDGCITFNCEKTQVELLKEIRKGIESSNDQMIRLSQILQNFSSPPLQVQVKNAFFAHNQQINQHESPKDLDKNAKPNNNEKTTP